MSKFYNGYISSPSRQHGFPDVLKTVVGITVTVHLMGW